MIELVEEIYNRVKPIIEAWSGKDIYAISFFVYDDEDDVLKPTVTLGYNIDAHYKDSIKDAYDEQEAKWNYCFWLQNEELIFGIDDTASLIYQWVLENGLESYTDENQDELFDENMIYIGKGPLLTQRFVEVLIEVAKRLHANKVMINKFGRDIPIIIHELEYYKAIADETRLGNPDGQADNFINWVLSAWPVKSWEDR